MGRDIAPAAPFDRARYLRVVRFFGRATAHVILWDIALRNLGGRRLAERSAERRWRGIAHGFRALAIELGGVLIKLGQFLSVRVDVLPRAVTAELAGLQDEVPAERQADIEAVIESEFGRPVSETFAWFRGQPQAAASLAQVHQAQLLSGAQVVVKVQRPGIETCVETDLRAVHTLTGWLNHYGPLRRRVDLDQLYAEFSRTTRSELDFIAEGHNAERFARNLADNPRVRIPKIYEEMSTRRVLVMEDVSSIKITDFEAIEAAGISRKEVARCLVDIYLQQVFVHNFVHADPHPGNLFVQPLEGEAGSHPPAASPPEGGRPFLLVFVDFGMVAVVPPRLREHLRDYFVGFVSRDAARMVRAFQGAGVLRPGADLARLEQAEAELLERYWGLTLGQAQQTLMHEWQSLAIEYRDILSKMPFQLPTDLLFVGRAIAILLGIATSLDADFDPWAAIAPFAQSMATQEAKHTWREVLAELERAGRLILTIPGQVDRFFGQASRGELVVRSSWTPEATQTLKKVEGAVRQMATAIIFSALLLAAVAVYLIQGAGVLSYGLFGLSALALLVALTRR